MCGSLVKSRGVGMVVAGQVEDQVIGALDKGAERVALSVGSDDAARLQLLHQRQLHLNPRLQSCSELALLSSRLAHRLPVLVTDCLLSPSGRLGTHIVFFPLPS